MASACCHFLYPIVLNPWREYRIHRRVARALLTNDHSAAVPVLVSKFQRFGRGFGSVVSPHIDLFCYSLCIYSSFCSAAVLRINHRVAPAAHAVKLVSCWSRKRSKPARPARRLGIQPKSPSLLCNRASFSKFDSARTIRNISNS